MIDHMHMLVSIPLKISVSSFMGYFKGKSAFTKWWNGFAEKHPGAAKWIREGGLFFLFSNLVTVWQYILIQFLPAAFSAYKDVEWMWPGIGMSLFGANFTFNVLGYSVVDGGLAYFIAYLIATFTAQCINFPLQRNITFRSMARSHHRSLDIMVIFFIVNKIIFPEGEKKADGSWFLICFR